MSEKKKFEACLIRTDDDQFIVAEWDQLVTAADKSKLRIGSCVGYKKPTGKREKTIRGTIVIMGKLSVCEQQKKLLMTKSKKKKPSKSNTEKKRRSQNESLDFVTSKIPLDSNDESSSDSNSCGLHIDSEEESKEEDDIQTVHIESKENDPTTTDIQRQDNRPTTTHIQHKDYIPKEVFNEQKDDASNVEQSDISATTKQIRQIDNVTTETDNRKDAAATSQSNMQVNENRQNSLDIIQRKDSNESNQCKGVKRTYVSMSSFKELEADRDKWKRKAEMYESQWMPRPREPTVIRYIVKMGEILSSNGELEEDRGEKLADICTALEMTDQQLQRLKKGNGTKTARNIIRALYPSEKRARTDPEDVEDRYRCAIHDYVDMFHGMEGLTKGKINESINNVFRSAKSQQKQTENH